MTLPSDKRVWLASYPQGVPAEIDVHRLPTLKALFEQACVHYADSVALVQMGRSLTYRDLDELSRAFGAWLQSRGVRKGDRVAIMLPNILQFPVALFAALRIGAVVVTVNPVFTASEVERQLRDCGASVVVTLDGLSHVVETFMGRLCVNTLVTTGVGDLLKWPLSWIVNRSARRQYPLRPSPQATPLSAALAAGRKCGLQAVDVAPEDLAFLQYTGGTTGMPKGAMLSHRNVCANVLQSEAWIRGFLTERATLLTALPLYHIFALEGSLLLFTHLGWRNVLAVNARDIPSVIAQFRRHAITYVSGVSTLFTALLARPEFNRVSFGLKITLSGGMALPSSVAAQWKAVTGCEVTQAWGLTETSPGACIGIPGNAFTSSVGLPIPSTQIAIKDDLGHEVGLDQVGEICVRGPQVMQGYWQQPEETDQVFWPNGWLRTGDLGRMDASGFVYLEDRIKDLIVVSGFKVYPGEVEAVAQAFPEVKEVAAVGCANAHSGERVVLFVVPTASQLDIESLLAHCRQSLAPYKQPIAVHLRTELPKTALGKVLRRRLRAELPAEVGGAAGAVGA